MYSILHFSLTNTKQLLIYVCLLSYQVEFIKIIMNGILKIFQELKLSSQPNLTTFSSVTEA